MIDKKWRLFGKVSIIDLAALVIVILAAWGVWIKLWPRAVHPLQVRPAEVTVLIRPVMQPTVDAVKPGMQIYERKSNTWIGQVKEVKSVPTTVLVVMPDGRVQEQPSPDRFDVSITIAGVAQLGTPASPEGWAMGWLPLQKNTKAYLGTDYWEGEGPIVDVNLDPAAP